MNNKYIFKSLEAKHWILSCVDKGKDIGDIADLFPIEFGDVHYVGNKRQCIKEFIKRVIREREKKWKLEPARDDWKKISHQFVTDLMRKDGDIDAITISKLMEGEFDYCKELQSDTWYQIALRIFNNNLDVLGVGGVNTGQNDGTGDVNMVDIARGEEKLDESGATGPDLLPDEDYSDDEGDEYEDGKGSGICDVCDVAYDPGLWCVGCYFGRGLCSVKGHISCMLPSIVDPHLLYCESHWLRLFGTGSTSSSAMAIDDNEIDIRLIRIITDAHEERLYFYKNGRGYLKTSLAMLTKKELSCVQQYRCQFRKIQLSYALEETDPIPIRIGDNSRHVLIRRFRVNGCLAPFCAVEQILVERVRSWLQAKGQYYYKNKETLRKKYKIAFQAKGSRCKAACNYAYKTNTEDKSLDKCKFKFEDMFDDELQQQDIRQLCNDLATIAKAVGIQDVDWLLNDSVTEEIPFLITTYFGTGLNSHIDENFEGPVFVITVWINKRSNQANDKKSKRVSWGQIGSCETNPHASFENHTNQMYFFFGFFTDWGYHGVPKQKGWTSIVLIIRQRRLVKIIR